MRYNQRFLRISSLMRPHPSPSTTCGTFLYHLWYLLIHLGVWRSVPWCMALRPTMHGALSSGVWRSVPWCMALCPVVHDTLFPDA
ncbi:MAG: hypothetical protein IJ699_07435 [Bacteroidaceae bacterium]|nr:hypothetical protein [Bacteroidaceae bacterium]